MCDVVVDGENIPVAEVYVAENSGWLYREQWDNFVIWPEDDAIENRLLLRFVADEVRLGFPYTPYAGSVAIVSSAGRNDGTYDLRCPEWKEGEAVQYADFSFDCHHVYSPLELLLYGAGILPFIGFILLILFDTLCYRLGLAWLGKGSLRFDFLVLKLNSCLALPAGVKHLRPNRSVDSGNMQANWVNWMLPSNILKYLITVIIFFLSWIQLEFSSTFDSWTDVFTMSGKYIAINVMTVWTVYLLIHSIVNSLWKSSAIFSAFITLLSAVNYYVVEFHGTPLTFMELRNFKTALNVIDNYKFDIKDIAKIICIFCVEIALCYIVKK